MRGLILAAGRGSRMVQATADRPKALVELGGRPLLDWQLASLREAGIAEIAVVRGYRGEAFAGRGLPLFDNLCWAETNMVASLAAARTWLEAGPCIVSYADIFYPAEAVRRLAAAEGDIVLAYDPDWLSLWSRRFADPLADAETFRIDPSGCVREIGGKTRNAAAIQGQYVGLFRLTPAGWRRIESFVQACAPERRAGLDVTGMLAGLIDSGVTVHGVPIPGPWGEVDEPSDLALYKTMIVEGKLRAPQP